MANTRSKSIKVTRLQVPGQRPTDGRARNGRTQDRAREDRITMDVVVDAYDAAERNHGQKFTLRLLEIEDAIERLCFIAKIEEGLRQSDARQLVSHDEIKTQFLT